MYGLLKENGPFLVDSKKPANADTFLTENHYSWHKIANILYIDNPVGTGFSHFRDEPSIFEIGSNPRKANQVSIELAEFLVHFMKLYPYYVGFQPNSKIYLFGESYGGTYVTKLGGYILKHHKYKVKTLFFRFCGKIGSYNSTMYCVLINFLTVLIMQNLQVLIQGIILRFLCFQDAV